MRRSVLLLLSAATGRVLAALGLMIALAGLLPILVARLADRDSGKWALLALKMLISEPLDSIYDEEAAAMAEAAGVDSDVSVEVH